MMAMVRSRPARKLEIALPTPTPPTSREARPIRPMNWVSRSSQKRMPPPASASPLTRQPASGKRPLSASRAATSERPGGRRRRYSQVSRLPGWTRPNSVDRLEGDHQPRAEACEGVQPAVGLAGDDAAHLDGDLAHPHAIAQRQVHALERRLLDHRAPDAVAPGQGVGERAAALQLDRAVERIGGLDRLELDQGRPSVGLDRPRHGAAVDPAHELALRLQEVDLLGRRLAIEQRDRHVAAQDLARVGAQAFLDGAAERQDGGDRRRRPAPGRR